MTAGIATFPMAPVTNRRAIAWRRGTDPGVPGRIVPSTAAPGLPIGPGRTPAHRARAAIRPAPAAIRRPPTGSSAGRLNPRDEGARPSGPPAGRGGQRPPYGGGPPSRDRPWVAQRPQSREWARPAVALPAPDLLGPEEELVAGRRPVEEAFAAGRPALRLLVVPQRREPLEKLVLHATRLRIPIVELEGGSLTALAGFDGHQGVALVVEPRQFASLEAILDRATERGEPPFVLVLDSLEDPQNVGTLLRSAEAAGVHGVVFPTRRQAPLTPAAIKASAGAVEHLLLCPVDDLAGALADLHSRGLRIAGSEADAPLTARQSDLRGPIAIVVGSEGQGLGPAIRRRCDMLMRIPMRGAVGSLNAAVAGSILVFEAVAQRDPEGRAQRPVSAPWPTPSRPTAVGSPAPGDEEAEPGSGPIETADPDATSAPVEMADPATPDDIATAGPASDDPAIGDGGPLPVLPPGDDPEAPSSAGSTQPDDQDLLPGAPVPARVPKPRKPRAPRKD